MSSWIFPARLTFVTYIVICCYFTYFDLTKNIQTKVRLGKMELYTINKKKIMRDTWPTIRDMVDAGLPQVLLYTIGCCSNHLYEYHIELPPDLPSWYEFIGGFMLCLIVGDFLIYWEHRLMHKIQFLRKHVHYVHHTYKMTFSWAGGWVHPFEDLIVIVCQTVTPIGFNIHPVTMWVFLVFWTVCLIEEHSGHHVWWSLSNLSWIFGGGKHHCPHHDAEPGVNFGFIFSIWDELFKTAKLQKH